MGRIKLKFHLNRRQKLIFELGVAVLCMIMLLGALNVITTTHKVPILTTEDLWEHANTTYVRFEFRNTTDPVAGASCITVPLSDIATYYNGYLYISIPYPDGYGVLRIFSIYNFTASTGGVVTSKYMVDHGVNQIHVYMEPINSTDVTFRATYQVSPLRLLVNEAGDNYIWWTDYPLLEITDETALATADGVVKWKALFPDNGTLDKTIDIDVGELAIKAAGHNGMVGILRFCGDMQNLDGLKLKIEMDAVSKKPVLAAFTEPIYSFFAGLWGALVGVVRRAKSIIGHAFGGFSLSALFTGLIGNPAIAVGLTCFIFVLILAVHKRKI